MRIGIDITTLAYQGFGVTNYTYNLVKNLLTIDDHNQYHLFYSSFNESKNTVYLEEFQRLGAVVHMYNIPLPILRIFWGKLNIIPVEWLIGKMDVFYFSDFLRPPLLKGTRGVTTIHDLVWKIYPQYHENFIVGTHEKKIVRTIKNKDTIIADSESTKNDLIKYFPEIHKKLVHVIYPGIGSEFKPTENKQKIKEILKKYRIDPQTRFLFYVGAVEPRKNLDMAFRVFAKLIKDSDYSNFKFIIAGKAGWKNRNIRELVKTLHLNEKVIFIGFVAEEDLPMIYEAASLTIYLSRYEGFGLPPLESLACGTKVIAGDNSSMRETLSNDFLVEVSDENIILDKIKHLLENNGPVNSLEVRKKYSWRVAAGKFLKIIDSK